MRSERWSAERYLEKKQNKKLIVRRARKTEKEKLIPKCRLDPL